MKSLKMMVASCAGIAALAAVPTVHAQNATMPTATPAPQSAPAQPHHHARRAAPNDNGCTGPVSFCNTYFGN